MVHPAPHHFRYSPRIDQALSFAAEKHAAQRRKGTAVPYIVHPVHVAWLLQSYGLDEDTVVAGILHDVLEDTATSRAELVAIFGEAVAETVWQCSEPDKSLPWEERKQGAVARMHAMTPAARAVSCADKAHNLHTIADSLDQGDQSVWQRFKRGPAAQLDYHRQALAALADGWTHPLLDELRAALARLEGRVPDSAG